jgi:hypothetical protein
MLNHHTRPEEALSNQDLHHITIMHVHAGLVQC